MLKSYEDARAKKAKNRRGSGVGKERKIPPKLEAGQQQTGGSWINVDEAPETWFRLAGL